MRFQEQLQKQWTQICPKITLMILTLRSILHMSYRFIDL